MREAEIRKRVRARLVAQGYHPAAIWCPPKVKFHESDILGVADMVAARGRRFRLIQFTTRPHIGERSRKIQAWQRLTGVTVPVEVWGWDDRQRRFSEVTV